MKTWIYKHYKWNLYEVIWVAKHAESLEEMVVYKSLYDQILWTRPKKIFEEEIIVEWKKVFRFKYMWNENYKSI